MHKLTPLFTYCYLFFCAALTALVWPNAAFAEDYAFDELRLFFTPEQREAFDGSRKLQTPDALREARNTEKAQALEKSQPVVSGNVDRIDRALDTVATHLPIPKRITYNGYIRHAGQLILFVDGRQLIDHPTLIRQDVADDGASITLWLAEQAPIVLAIGHSALLENK